MAHDEWTGPEPAPDPGALARPDAVALSVLLLLVAGAGLAALLGGTVVAAPVHPRPADRAPTRRRPSLPMRPPAVLQDLCTGRSIAFLRGEGTSEALRIDHAVSLADAWRTGRSALSRADAASDGEGARPA